MPRWTVEYERRALRDLRRLDPPVRKRVVAAIDRLVSGDPPATYAGSKASRSTVSRAG